MWKVINLHEAYGIGGSVMFKLLRVAYGLLLGTVLFIPFGAYHSRVEPYIIGFLWGYHLPVGYAALVSGLVVILYPKLTALKGRLDFWLWPLVWSCFFLYPSQPKSSSST